MSSLSDNSFQRERRRRPTPRPRGRELPWGLYVGFLAALWVAAFLGLHIRAVWAPWLLLGAVLVVAAWAGWELWAGRRRR